MVEVLIAYNCFKKGFTIDPYSDSDPRNLSPIETFFNGNFKLLVKWLIHDQILKI